MKCKYLSIKMLATGKKAMKLPIKISIAQQKIENMLITAHVILLKPKLTFYLREKFYLE